MAVIQELVALLGFDLTGERDLTRFQAGIASAESGVNRLAASATRAAKTMVVGLGAAIGATATKTASDAIEFEDAFAGVLKVVDVTEAGAEALQDQFLDLATAIGLPIPGLLEIAEAQGQAGIQAEGLAARTRLVAIAAKAMDLSTEQSGNQIAVFANLFKLSGETLEDFLDTINHVSNTTAAKAGQITAAVNKSAGAVQTLGLSRHDLVGLTAGLIATGSEATTAGLAINNLGVRLADNRKDVIKGVSELGLSMSDLQKQINAGEGAAAITSILEALNSVENATDKARISASIFGGEYGKNWLSAAAGSETLRKALANANNEQERAGALLDEFQRQNSTTASVLTLMRNALKAVSVTIGTELLPLIKDVANQIIEWAKAFRGSDEAKAFAQRIKNAVAVALDVLKFARQEVTSFVDNIRTLYDAFMQWAEGAGIAEEASMALGIGLGLIAASMFPVSSAILGLILVFNDLFDYLAGNESFIGDFIAGFSSMFEGEISAIMAVIDSFVQTFGAAWDWVAGRWESFIAAIQPGIEDFKAAFAGLGDIAAPFISLFDALGGEVDTSKTFGELTALLKGLADLGLEALSTAINIVANSVCTLVEASAMLLRGDFSGAWMRLGQGIIDAMSIVGQSVLDIIRIIFEFVGALDGFDGGAVFDSLVQAFENLPARIEAAWDQFDTWLKNRAKALGDALADAILGALPDTVLDFFGIKVNVESAGKKPGDNPGEGAGGGGTQPPPPSAPSTPGPGPQVPFYDAGGNNVNNVNTQQLLNTLSNLSSKLGQATADSEQTIEQTVNETTNSTTNVDQDNRSTISITQNVTGATAPQAAGAAVQSAVNRNNSNRALAVDANTPGAN